MPGLGRFVRILAALTAVIAAMVGMAALGGCHKSEPEPSAPGYYTGPMKPKGEVAPPGGGQTGGKKPGAALGPADK